MLQSGGGEYDMPEIKKEKCGPGLHFSFFSGDEEVYTGNYPGVMIRKYSLKILPYLVPAYAAAG
ncbi:hypothetical protein B14911_08035 [Bacillus sp. NRRL B-14911]|uniref:Uncharacterized protein n=2 Tax=Bacillaceae TaxID=186817 RepID=U5LCA4_9BACI|nr:hypothetical protein N288_18005 [Bacillus infantis NRRL B-14911]EAR65185.1 hypothetical protein B14911_08035 [Bacillus sp. NRRL B-14911]PLR72599.1 hypothetical protein CYJ37_13770 [Bacillus sp. UMB0728]